METAADRPYPGETATANQVLALAEVYRQAAGAALGLSRRGVAISRAPYRLLAIHAIELHLNALLLHAGHDAGQVRGMQHDLAERCRKALALGLPLRKRTVAHLAELAGSREYLVTRYGPEMAATLPNTNRLAATLNDIADKTAAWLARPPGTLTVERRLRAGASTGTA